MTLSKSAKIRVLENYHALDFVLFGKPLAKVATDFPFLKEDYLSVKGALLSVMVEMYKMIECNPPEKQQTMNESRLLKVAMESADRSRTAAKNLVKTEKGKLSMTKSLKESILLKRKAGKKVKIEWRKLVRPAKELLEEGMITKKETQYFLS